MQGNGVGAEGIDYKDAIVMVRGVLQRQTRVAQLNCNLCLAVAQEGEVARIPGNAQHGWVNFVIGEVLTGFAVSSQRTRPQADHRHFWLGGSPGEDAEELADGTRAIVVEQGLAPRSGSRY